jgi:hypothetical protein
MQTPTEAENHHGSSAPVAIEPSQFIPHDLWIYRLAVGGISASLVAFLLAGAIVGASGHAGQMSKEYWAIGAALVGALVGIIAPSPQQKREDALQRSEGQESQESKSVTATSTVTWRDRLESMYQPALLIVALGVSLWVSSEITNPESAAILRTLAAGSAGGLLGLMVPNPHSSKQ